MIEILTGTLIVLFFILVTAGCIAAIVAAVYLTYISAFLVNLLDYLKGALVDGFQTLQDSTKADADAILKVDTDNSQKIYDSLVLAVRMLNLVLEGLGYRPRGPDETGLTDPEAGGNHGSPPAPREEEGLTYQRR